MSVDVDVQLATDNLAVPPASAFRLWAETALAGLRDDVELAVRVIDGHESQTLNQQFRGRDYPTNVLSFPFAAPEGVPSHAIGNYLGDLAICAPLVEREAAEQGKTPAAHWAHMVVHGVLHLCGFDHLNEAEAEAMETREREVLARLGFDDPYHERYATAAITPSTSVSITDRELPEQ